MSAFLEREKKSISIPVLSKLKLASSGFLGGQITPRFTSFSNIGWLFAGGDNTVAHPTPVLLVVLAFVGEGGSGLHQFYYIYYCTTVVVSVVPRPGREAAAAVAAAIAAAVAAVARWVHAPPDDTEFAA